MATLRDEGSQKCPDRPPPPSFRRAGRSPGPSSPTAAETALPPAARHPHRAPVMMVAAVGASPDPGQERSGHPEQRDQARPTADPQLLPPPGHSPAHPGPTSLSSSNARDPCVFPKWLLGSMWSPPGRGPQLGEGQSSITLSPFPAGTMGEGLRLLSWHPLSKEESQKGQAA